MFILITQQAARAQTGGLAHCTAPLEQLGPRLSLSQLCLSNNKTYPPSLLTFPSAALQVTQGFVFKSGGVLPNGV